MSPHGVGVAVILVDAEMPHLRSTLLNAESLDRQRPGWRYLRELLATPQAPAGKPAQDDLIEPLTERELDVLRLLASELDGPAIARRLVVSLNTVRTHTKNIYAKLGVNNRRAAVRRAHQLNLLSRSHVR